MSVWGEAKTGDGRTYYWNKETKETRWSKPDDFEAGAAPATPATPAVDQATIDASWREAKAGNGRPYYYNSITKKTVWEAPEEYLRQQQNARPAGNDFVAGGGTGFGARDDFPNRDRRMERRDDREHHLPQKPSYDGGRGGGAAPWEGRQDNAGFRGPMPAKSDEPDYATPEQAEEAYFKVLRKHGIMPDSPYEDVLRVVIKEKDFRAIKDAYQRKLAFEKYCIEVRAQEKRKEKERKARLRDDFRKMLSTHDDIVYYTRWKTARPLIEREAVFKQASDDDERRQMFDEYIVELKRKHNEDEITKRRMAQQEIEGLMQALIIDPDTTWKEAQDTITSNEQFTEREVFRSLPMIDMLTAFEVHVNELTRARNEAKQRDKRLGARRERKARDAFRELLQEMLRDGKIKAGSKWQDFYPLVENDDRYTNLIGTPGSSPLDFFWDVVEEEERKLRSKRNDALDVLEDRRYEMTLETTVDDFTRVMYADSRTAKLNEEEVRMIYDRLMEKIFKRAEESKMQDEKAKRKAIDALRSIIKHLDPPVRLDETYEDVVPRLQNFEEFHYLDDEARRSAFEKQMRRMKDKEQDDVDRERARRDRDRDQRNGSRRESDVDRDRRHRTRTPEVDAYEADRKRAQADRERQYRKASFGLTPPGRERRDDRYDDGGRRRGHERGESIYDRERREREMERERHYVDRADPRDKGRTLDYGDEEVGSGGAGSRPGSVRKRRESDASAVVRDAKRARRGTKTPEPDSAMLKEERELQSGSEEGEIEEV